MPQVVSEAVQHLLSRAVSLPPWETWGRLRRAGGLTQAEVSAAIGIHRVQVARWESGKAEPRPPHRQDYALLLHGLAKEHPEALTDPSLTSGACER
ncbi:helix-turn-helix domain-containing protein (plasmid) [Streptomyces sp. NBC_00841]|uniref:helix-turn-helix domain-containing protein n=1 Tax=Streptomyces sp. NBC_00841 TaxID=2975847 RepID=UPI002DDA43BC|nr:helix-turn-helix domain-containing protein [Streptomyces sp. NBC_00841]WSA06025.1 helix-turn-helix domain-containing protein [Streptomyces sp. NBC_00841]